jgi:lipopolysaccharide transport system permease protein
MALEQAQTHFVIDLPETIIQPPRGWITLQLSQLWNYRDLVYLLSLRDIKLRYKQTIIGSLWAIIQPLLNMLIFTVIFNYLARISTDDIPYPVFVYTALAPWTFFIHALTKTSTCLIMDSEMITKVYFPRLIIPISVTLAAIADFFISLIVLLGLMFYFGVLPSWNMAFFPVIMAMLIATALGFGLWLSVLNIQYRDISHMLPFMTQLWFFVTPVFYPLHLIPEKWRLLFALNPLTGIIEGFRWALLGDMAPRPGLSFVVSAVTATLILVSGLYFFKWREPTFADVV